MQEASAASLEAWKDMLRAHVDTGVPAQLFSGESACFALLADPKTIQRAERRGVTVINAGTTTVSACLFFQGRIYGVYAGPAASPETVIKDMAEFRLGWLPDEAVRANGGFGSAFATIPPEAEGFPVVLITGPKREIFAGHGRIIDNPA